ncbi:MAG: hypothetical protein OXU20_01005 [Myxococcales bacterium]|nr:hypothetical protein [Myxococcales bacterium]MDD9969756.1 hypothetical protein [Myxococcales bacterium]
MLHLRGRLLRACVVLLPLVLGGCTQGEGEPCQVDADCESNLRCDALGGARGTCVSELPDMDESDETVPDAAMPGDDEDAGS